MKNSNKRKVKIVALVVAALFALGIVGVAVTQSQVGFAAPAVKNSAIGYIDTNKALSSHPDMAGVETTMKAEVESAQKQLETEGAKLSDQEKQRFYAQLQQRLQQKEAELINAVAVKIEASVEKVAKAKGLAIVVQRNNVIYGGVDITDDVIKDFGK